MTEGTPTRRRWFQFRLRTLLILVLVLSLPLSWFAVRMERARKQKETAEMILQEGWGVVLYDWQAKGAASPPYPAWLRGLLGDDFFCSVHTAAFADTDFGDVGAFIDTDSGDEVPAFGDEELAFVGTDFGDEEMACLKSLKDLERVELHFIGITDAGLEHVEGLVKLRLLNLWGTKVSDAGLERLQGLTHLEILQLDHTEITDAGLEHLKGLPNLKWLTLHDTKVTVKGVKKLQEALPNCEIKY